MVIGGGNTAMDAARVPAIPGVKKVSLVYRRTKRLYARRSGGAGAGSGGTAWSSVSCWLPWV